MGNLQMNVSEIEQPRALIVEGTVSGHRLYYVRILASHLAQSGWNVTVVTRTGGLETKEALLHLAGLSESVSLVESESLRLCDIESISRDVSAVLTVVPDGDWLLKELPKRVGWRGSGKLKFLIMREDSQSANAAKKLLGTVSKRILRTLVGTFPRVSAVTLKSAVWMGRQRNIARDPVTRLAKSTDLIHAAARFGLDDGRYWFAIVGAISARKNLSLVAQAISEFGDDRIGFLVAGLCPTDELAKAQPWMDRLRTKGVKVVVLNRLLTDLEVDSFVGAVDCVVLAHSNEGPSGLFGKAAGYGTRVVAAGAVSLRVDTAFIPNLATWAPLSVPDVANALEAASVKPAPSKVDGLGPDDFARAMS